MSADRSKGESGPAGVADPYEIALDGTALQRVIEKLDAELVRISSARKAGQVIV